MAFHRKLFRVLAPNLTHRVLNQELYLVDSNDLSCTGGQVLIQRKPYSPIRRRCSTRPPYARRVMAVRPHRSIYLRMANPPFFSDRHPFSSTSNRLPTGSSARSLRRSRRIDSTPQPLNPNIHTIHPSFNPSLSFLSLDSIANTGMTAESHAHNPMLCHCPSKGLIVRPSTPITGLQRTHGHATN